MAELAVLLNGLSRDEWRDTMPYSAEMLNANEALMMNDESARQDILRKWLARYQPCLFGRIAAKRDLLDFCFLTEDDIAKGDQFLRDKIQRARCSWTGAGYTGLKSGFIVLAVSPKLLAAKPDRHLCEFALKLGSLYLMNELEVDQIYCDDIYLERPGAQTVLKWLAGVNVFASSSDGRWWQDHRIPGGLGFSVNSVGHFVKSAQIAQAQTEMDKLFDDPNDEFAQQAIDNLPKALEFAMRTIDNASQAVSGKATYLLKAPDQPPKCPIDAPPNLKGMNCHEYEGFYHTDVTIPSTYFQEAITRPEGVTAVSLDFTYLFDKGVDNHAYQTMGVGRRVRSHRNVVEATRAMEEVVTIGSQPRLIAALSDGK